MLGIRDAVDHAMLSLQLLQLKAILLFKKADSLLFLSSRLLIALETMVTEVALVAGCIMLLNMLREIPS